MHITKEQLNDYMSGKMIQTKQAAFLEHISECEFCAGKLADTMLKRELTFTPPDLKENIQEFVITNIKKRQKEFWIYTARVVFSVCAAVTIIMMPSGILLGSSDSGYREARFALTKEITEEEVRNNLKILDLLKNTSAKISDDVFKALNLDKK